ATTTLLGPPEIYSATTTTTSDNVFNSSKTNRNPPMGLTENMSATFLSTSNPCVDFFFHVVPDTPSETLLHRLRRAWSHNPVTTLKLVCNLRGVRGTGKSDRKGFYTAALWFHRNHPKTLASNVPSLADFGYFKDLPEILYRLLEGSSVRKIQKHEWEQRKSGSKNKRSYSPYFRTRKPNKKRKLTNKPNGWKGTEKDSLMSEETAARAKAQKETAHALK
ncbi:plant/T31B5-30 protein, partial [Trifolium medium]|nr:plant/T31B5-30 protein [Trifolium medium]